ncbi:MAG: VOC family protein [Thermoleophilia bacterium]
MSDTHDASTTDTAADGPVEAGTARRDFLRNAAVAGLGATTAGSLLVSQATATSRRGHRHDSALPGEDTLGGNIGGALFLTINVSDLDRAVEFYEATYPVKRAEVIDAPSQAFLGMGIRRGSFRARMMRDTQQFQGAGLLLVQWLDPKPVGKPYAEANHVGWYREHASATRTGQTARYAQAEAAGGRPYGEPSLIYIRPDYQIYSFAFRDPDGTTLEWTGPLDPTPDGPDDTVTGPNTNCRNIHESYKFYRNVLGFDMSTRLNPTELQPPTNGSLGDTLRNPDGSLFTGDGIDYDAAIMVPRTDGRNSVDLLEWQVPKTYGVAYKHANNLGMMTLTYQVNSVDVVYRKLHRLLRNPRKYIVAPPETWDLGEYGVRKTLNIVDPDGTRFAFFEKVYTTDPTP